MSNYSFPGWQNELHKFGRRLCAGESFFVLFFDIKFVEVYSCFDRVDGEATGLR